MFVVVVLIILLFGYICYQPGQEKHTAAEPEVVPTDETVATQISETEAMQTKETETIQINKIKVMVTGVPEVTLIGNPEIIMSSPNSKHNYFAWPTVCRLQDGRLAVAASGYRLGHVCPFGRCVVSYSTDEGATYSAPAPVIDTVLDDRDGGILAYGENNVIITTFNNTVASQRRHSSEPYQNSYLELITREEEAQALGSLYAISTDGGITFGEPMKSPVTSPHGPCLLSDGTILWVGTMFDTKAEGPAVQVYTIGQDGTMEKVGVIEDIPGFGSYEPYAIETDDGTIICHIRVQSATDPYYSKFTIYQTESTDRGKTWSVPHQILKDTGGAPSHIVKHSSGVLIAVYGVRSELSGINAMFSCDDGKTWMTDFCIYDSQGNSWDVGYPSTVELKDGSLLTVFYDHPTEDAPAVIMQQKWTF